MLWVGVMGTSSLPHLSVAEPWSFLQQRMATAFGLLLPEFSVIVKTTPSPARPLSGAKFQYWDNNQSQGQSPMPSRLLRHGPRF